MKLSTTILALLMLLFTMALMTGCGNNGPAWVPAPIATQTVTSTSTATATETTLQEVLDQENAYLESIGQHDLVPGLACTLYTVPTSTTQIAGTTNLTYAAAFPYVGAFNQPDVPVTDGFNVLPTALQPIFQTWFIMKCTGYMVGLDNNYHQFSLTSDDGSLLTIDSLLINNDGEHGSQTVSNTKLMTVGAHWFELDFFQAAGYQTLVLSEDGTVMDGSLFYH